MTEGNSIEIKRLNKKFHLEGGDVLNALEGVSFEVKEGEIFGIIGPNGSGKSTLLRILSGVAKPDSGEAFFKGRALGILDIGTGFHPDLSGMENLRLKGQMFGLNNAEIESIQEEVISFSELGKDIHRQVKHYSNGMYLRLAFSIFIHIDTDILLLDEVFNVGDESFRRKCESRFKHMSEAGKTIVLVSHDLNSILENCHRCLWLEEGQVKTIGNARNIVERYMAETLDIGDEMIYSDGPKSFDLSRLFFNDRFEISKLEITHTDGSLTPFRMEDEIRISFIVQSYDPNEEFGIILQLTNGMGHPVLCDSPMFRTSNKILISKAEKSHLSVVIPGGILNHGIYHLNVIATIGQAEPRFLNFVGGFRIGKSDLELNAEWDFPAIPFRPHLKWILTES